MWEADRGHTPCSGQPGSLGARRGQRVQAGHTSWSTVSLHRWPERARPREEQGLGLLQVTSLLTGETKQKTPPLWP